MTAKACSEMLSVNSYCCSCGSIGFRVAAILGVGNILHNLATGAAVTSFVLRIIGKYIGRNNGEKTNLVACVLEGLFQFFSISCFFTAMKLNDDVTFYEIGVCFAVVSLFIRAVYDIVKVCEKYCKTETIENDSEFESWV